MNDSLKRIIEANVDGQTMEDYLCDLLTDLDTKEVEMEKMAMKISVLKQINNRHNNLNNSYKYELAEARLRGVVKEQR